MIKNNIEKLAIFGGNKLFTVPKSTSNLLQPSFEKFLSYSKNFYEQKQYTNNGPNVQLLEKRLAEFHETEYCVTFSSGFWALALAIRVLALPDKNEIIMPSLTYRRMADIASWVNLKPHFCEVSRDSLAMTVDTVKECINENTALILGVHPIVNCCNVEEIVSLGNEYQIPVIFDSVESVNESIATGKIGQFGEAECFSLHACKLFNGFGGGYLTTNNRSLAIQLASMRTFGFVGVDEVAVPGGMNAKLNEIHASMALASLDGLDAQVSLNKERYLTYKNLLNTLGGIRLLEFDESYQTGYKNIVVELLDDWPLTRTDTIKILNADNILARPYYYPALHRKRMNYDYVPASLPVTDDLAERFLNLPCGQLVSNQDIEEIVKYLKFIQINEKNINDALQKLEGK